MDELMELIGDIPFNGITFGVLILLITVCIFLYKTYKNFKKMIIDNYKASSERDQKINSTFEEVKKYQEYRQHDIEQSLQIQTQLNESIEKLHTSQDAMAKQLAELDKRTTNYELSDTRDKLMQSYRYYTSPKHNPEGAWTELEHEAFFEMLRTYENSGGDGYMHSVVQPTMESLKVIPMSQINDITNLMHTRN